MNKDFEVNGRLIDTDGIEHVFKSFDDFMELSEMYKHHIQSIEYNATYNSEDKIRPGLREEDENPKEEDEIKNEPECEDKKYENPFMENPFNNADIHTLPTPGLTIEIFSGNDHVMDRFNPEDIKEGNPEFFEELKHYMNQYNNATKSHFMDMSAPDKIKNIRTYIQAAEILGQETKMIKDAINRLKDFPVRIERSKTKIAELEAEIEEEKRRIKTIQKFIDSNEIDELNNLKKSLDIMAEHYDNMLTMMRDEDSVQSE